MKILIGIGDLAKRANLKNVSIKLNYDIESNYKINGTYGFILGKNNDNKK